MLAILMTLTLTADDWPRIFGSDGSATSNVSFPTSWTADDYAWSVTLPGEGHSSPVVLGDRLFLTTGVDAQTRRMLCLSSKDGRTLWQHDVLLKNVRQHRKNSLGSSSAAVTSEAGGRVVVLFADAFSLLLVATDLEGQEVWRQNLGPFQSQHGQGASPVIVADRVIVANDQLGESSVRAFDLASGDPLWSTPRKVSKTAYATPLMTTIADQPVVLLCSDAEGVSGVDPKDGRLLFASGPQPQRVVASPVVVDRREDGVSVLISSGSGGTGKHMECVDVTRDGDEWTAEVRWTRTKTLPYVPTPVVAGGHLFLWNDGGTLACVDPNDGQTLWVERIGGKCSASPIVAGGRLYTVSEEGRVEVVDASADFHRYEGGQLPDASYATPSVGSDTMYFRGFGSLSALRSDATN